MLAMPCQCRPSCIRVGHFVSASMCEIQHLLLTKCRGTPIFLLAQHLLIQAGVVVSDDYSWGTD